MNTVPLNTVPSNSASLLRGPRLASYGCLIGMVVGALPAQESKALFHVPVAVLPVNTAPFQKLGDFDGDGDLDAVGSRVYSSGATSEVIVWENVQGAFSEAYVENVAPGLYHGHGMPNFAMTTADFNQDGRMDFALATKLAAVRFIALPNFQFAQTSMPLSGTPNGSRAIAAGDFDGDGVIDIAVASSDDLNQLGFVDVFLAGGVVASVSIPANANSDLRLLASELDASPGVELLVSDRRTSQAQVVAVAAGAAQVVTTMSTPLSSSIMPALWTAGDIDQDGDEDVVMFMPGYSPAPHRYQIFRCSPSGAFVMESAQLGGPAEYLADIDGDGDLDGVCCGGGGQTFAWPELDFPSTFELAENLGGGNFAPAWAFPGAGSRSMAGAADVDGDGDVDLVAGRCIYYGDGPWDEQPRKSAGAGNMPLLLRPWGVFDNDGDGDPDLGIQYSNRGDGEFAYTFPLLSGPPGYAVAGSTSCDVDGDGFSDQVVRLTTMGFPAQFVSMAWFRNNGGGHLHYVGPCGAPGMTMGPAGAWTADRYLAVDCDGDGDQDMIYKSQPSYGTGGTSELFWNNNGTFVPGPVFPSAAGRVDAVADFNGDGHPDLLMTSITSGVTVQLGSGPGKSFQLAWSRAFMPVEPGAVAIGDVNDDGALDFVRPDSSGVLVLFVNTLPQGTFGFAEIPLTGSSVQILGWQPAAVRPTVNIADFDADGRTDIAFASEVQPSVGVILRRTGWSNPASVGDFEVIQQIFGPGYATDADGDGMPDLVGSHTVRNRHYPRAQAGGLVQLHGAEVVGEAGTSPVLGASGPFRVGHTGEFLLRSVPGPTLAVLGLSLGQAQLPNVPFPGMSVYLDPATTLVANWPITENGDGRAAASASLPVVLIHGLQGFRFYVQALVLDPAAPHSLTQSNLMIMTVGS